MAIRLLLFGILFFRVAAAAASTDSVRISHEGLSIWLKADAGLKADKDNRVTEWLNESPNGKQGDSLLPVVVHPELSSQEWNGNPVVHFSESPATAIDEIINSGKDYSLFIVRSLGGTLSQDASRDAELMPPTESDMSDSFKLTRRISTDSTEADSGKPRLLSILKGSEKVKYWANGETVDQPDANMSDLTGRNASTAMFRGDVAEIILYNRRLSNGEKLRVEIYLADKYGIYHPNATWPLAYSPEIQDQIEANGWNEDQGKTYATFETQHQPINPVGLNLWLQADKGLESTDHTHLTAWLDQSPGGNNAYLPKGLSPPAIETSSINSKPTIRFDGNTRLETREVVTGGQDYSAFLVSSLGDNLGPFYNGDPGRSGWGFTKPPSTNSGSYSMLNGGCGYPTFGAIQNPTQVQVLSATRSQGIIHFYAYGKLSGTSDVSMADPTGVAFIGSIGTQNFNGSVAEILVYNRALSDSDRKQVEDYLMAKYGLSAVESAPQVSPSPKAE